MLNGEVVSCYKLKVEVVDLWCLIRRPFCLSVEVRKPMEQSQFEACLQQ